MQKIFIQYLISYISIILFFSCASIKGPSGGPIDKMSPFLLVDEIILVLSVFCAVYCLFGQLYEFLGGNQVDGLPPAQTFDYFGVFKSIFHHKFLELQK